MKRLTRILTLALTLPLLTYAAINSLFINDENINILSQGMPGMNEQKGWGFVKSKGEKGPGFTQWQLDITKESGSLFRVDTQEKKVALTFDLGYEEPGCTPKLLETLEKHQAKACFFVTGHYLKSQPQLAKAIVEKGHILGSHTWTHKNLAKLGSEAFTDEIMKWHNHALELTGQKGKYLRPPEGVFTRQTLKATRELGYQTVFWSIAILDWNPMPNPEEVVSGVVGQLHPGAIILLHGNSKDVTAKLDAMMTAVKDKGYRFVSLDEIQVNP